MLPLFMGDILCFQKLYLPSTSVPIRKINYDHTESDAKNIFGTVLLRMDTFVYSIVRGYT